MKNAEQKPSASTNESGHNKKRNHQAKKSKYGNQFKGETPGMNGKVFRLQSEQNKKGEFKDAMEALERYAGRAYPLDTTKLQTLFKKLETPEFEEPVIPTKEDSDSEDKSTHKPTEWEVIKFTKEYKLYLKNQERLTATLIALFNVVWGQCSRHICRSDSRLKRNMKKRRKTTT